MHTRAFIRPRFRALPPAHAARAEEIQCLPDLVRFNAEHNASAFFLLQALDHGGTEAESDEDAVSGDDQGAVNSGRSVSITFLAFYTATIRCRRTLSDALDLRPAGSSRQKPAPVALLLESDARSLLYLISLLWLGVPCLLLSPRLAAPAVRHLLRRTSVQAIVVSRRTASLAQAALAIDDVSVGDPINPEGFANHNGNPPPTSPFLLDVMSLDEAFPLSSPSPSVAESSCCNLPLPLPSLAEIGADGVPVDEADCDVLILHSSGTTGLPKPLTFPHRYLLGYAACHTFADDDDCSGVNVSTLPLFHGFGLLAPCLALSVGMPCCLPAGSGIPTGRSTLALVRRVGARSLMTVPSILEDLLADSDDDEADRRSLASLAFVAVGGGAMSTPLGQRLSGMGVRLLNHYGVTEIGALAPIFHPDPTYDWRYLRLRRDIGLRLTCMTDPSVAVHNNGAVPQKARWRIVGVPFGRDESFEVQDDLECHPVRPESEVRILGRTDDLIVLASGEKVRPTLLEQALLMCPLVKTAVVLGSGNFELVVLVEPMRPLHNDTFHAERLFVKAVWPFVLQGNAAMDAHAQITSEKAIIVKPPHKAIPRTPKGSVMRKESHDIFAEEIATAYRLLGIQTAFSLDYSNLEGSLRALITGCLPHHARQREWTDHDSVFELGIDSLQAIRLQRVLEASVAKVQSITPGKTFLPRNFIYLFETIAKMARALRQPQTTAVSPTTRQIAMESMVSRFRANGLATQPQRRRSGKHWILLTGSTGSIGSHVLQGLCRHSDVERVVCLVRRAEDAATNGLSSDTDHHGGHKLQALRATQASANPKHGIELTSEDMSKVDFLEWRPGAERLGLDEEQWTRIADGVSHILHCAWPMDFRRLLPSFEPHVDTIRCLTDLAALAHVRQTGHIVPRLVVLSSIAAVGRYPFITAHHQTVPEELITDPLVALPMGYAEAKWVCEHALDTLARQHVGRFDPVLIRLGQITGSTKTAYWNPKEHLPALFQASRKLGKLPLLEGDISWLPVDVAADVILDLLFAPQTARTGGDDDGGAEVFHVEHPLRRRWADIVPVVARRMGLPHGSAVPFADWYRRAVDAGVVDELLQDFLRAHFVHMSTGLVLDTTKARALSSTLRSASAPSHALIGRYVDV